MKDKMVVPVEGDYTVYDCRLAALARIRGVNLKGLWVMGDARVYFVFPYEAIKPVLLEWRTQSARVPLQDYLEALRNCTATVRRVLQAKQTTMTR